ncbi:MAG TPA: hypothetical protein VIJ96_16195 [Acidothermaceae bacterium]
MGLQLPGPLTFLRQASQAGLATEDGWEYFVAGWAAALAAIGDRELTIERLTAIRPRPPNYDHESRRAL